MIEGRPTAAPWWFGLGLVIAGLLWSNPVVVAVALLWLAVLATGEVWVRVGPREVSYRRHLSTERAFPDEEVRVEFVIENRKRLPLPRVVVEDEFPEGLALTGAAVSAHHQPGRAWVTNLFALAGWQRVRRTAFGRAGERGVYRFGPATLVCGDPLGLAQTTREVPAGESGSELLIVYPRLAPEVGRDAAPRGLPSGRRARARAGVADPYDFVGLREYVPGDPLKLIDWKATARAGKLQTRVLHPVPSRRAWIAVDISSAEHPFLGTDRDLAERIITTAATLAVRFLGQGQQVGILANAFAREWGPALKVAPSSAPSQAALVLEGLARLDVFPSMPLETLMRRELAPSAADHHLWFVGWAEAPGMAGCLALAEALGFRVNWVRLDRGEVSGDVAG